MNDEELMRRYLLGDEEAFNRLYEKYSPMVYGFLKRRLRESEVADLYQKVWRHFHEKRELWQGQPVGPWLFVMVRHLLIDEYRSLGRRREYQSEFLEKMAAPGAEEAPVDLEELLSTLPYGTADLIRKYYLDGVSYEALEKETGLSQANLRQRLSRALRGLRAKVQGN